MSYCYFNALLHSKSIDVICFPNYHFSGHLQAIDATRRAAYSCAASTSAPTA
jgi:hypothetical protein